MNQVFTKYAKQVILWIFNYFKDNPEKMFEFATMTKNVYSEAAKNAKKKQTSTAE